jgi:hypothetical protein
MRVLRSFCSESVVKQALTGCDVAIEAHASMQAAKTSVTCTLDMEQKMSHTMQCL